MAHAQNSRRAEVSPRRAWTRLVHAATATHRYVYLSGNARDRRRKHRRIKRMFPTPAFQAIETKDKYVSRSGNTVVITQPAVW